MKFENLRSVKTYARLNVCSTAYIYKLIKDKKIIPFIIDEVIFIDLEKYPSLKTMKAQ
jgi:hypothetical protein